MEIPFMGPSSNQITSSIRFQMCLKEATFHNNKKHKIIKECFLVFFYLFFKVMYYQKNCDMDHGVRNFNILKFFLNKKDLPLHCIEFQP
jgi:hypothetical protein